MELAPLSPFEKDYGHSKLYRLWLDNSLRNYNYVLADARDGIALLIDPTEVSELLNLVKDNALTAGLVLITHEHSDHVSGIAELMEQDLGYELVVPRALQALVSDTAWPHRLVDDGDQLHIGGLTIDVIATPGHTMAHVAYYIHGEPGLLVSGDTLFNAGVGNTKLGGDPDALFETMSSLCKRFAQGHTDFLPGHDLSESNLRFAASIDPSNNDVAALLERVVQEDPWQRPVPSFADERAINPFFRVEERSLLNALESKSEKRFVDARAAFKYVRSLRDAW